MDGAFGHHADVAVVGNEAYIFYFCHPYENDKERGNNHVTVIQAARLTKDGKQLFCNRDEVFEWKLN